ncbi:methyltransferase [Aaosphaeria arxii CBS 175.79]|uniref:Methyltransferase n=1 Tax=Aaosphaeria arxii CBS 175.79 TaxID=1450172 RepID=A0A6A5Y8S4_9PLEO|nr:methyltransferase [Aaosphaeria arxii CBS 175.79]KAF2020974.1 methyltransferase [Aaosphaeria arxii CBS 175.79]
MGLLDEMMVIFWAMVGPWQFMYMALSFLPPTVRDLVSAGQYQILFSISKFKHAWFTRFWNFWGPRIRVGRGPLITALFEGRVSGGVEVEKPVVPPVGGVILDIGPGPGFWVDLYAKAKVPANDEGNLRHRGRGASELKIYGVEPNPDAHPSLRKHVHDAGLDDNYQIVPVGIQSLSTAAGAQIEKGSVDCIVSLLCLCSIPDPEANIAELYQLLKKGGRWYMFEHVQVTRSWPGRLYQAFLNLFWPHVLGGCELCRNTEKTLRQAGPWDKFDVHAPADEVWCTSLPHIMGTLTK